LTCLDRKTKDKIIKGEDIKENPGNMILEQTSQAFHRIEYGQELKQGKAHTWNTLEVKSNTTKHVYNTLYRLCNMLVLDQSI